MTAQMTRRRSRPWLRGFFAEISAQRVGAALEWLGIAVNIVLFLGVLGVGDRGTECIGGACFLAFVASLRALSARLGDPLLALFWIWSLLFVEFPCACIAAMPREFPVDYGLAVELPVPGPSSIGWALTHLACCYLAVIASAAVFPARTRLSWPSIRPLWAIVVSIAMLVVGVLYDRFRTVLPGLERPLIRTAFEVMKIISYDSAIVTFWIAVFATWTPGTTSRSSSRLAAYAAACIGFVVIHTYNSSKGAILLLVFLAVGIPLSLALRCPQARIIVPRGRMLVLGAILSLPIFGFAEALRTERKLGSSNSPDAVSGIVDRLVSGELAESAALRLSVPFLRYLAIFDRFGAFDSGDRDSSTSYANYTARSLVNLVAPGTPFPDAYAPSSMVLDDLLVGIPLEGPDRDNLRAQLNSQPTTVFGFSFAVIGWWTPIAVLLASLVLRGVFVLGGFMGACFCAVLLQGALSCYGLDAAIQVSIAFSATIGTLLFLSRDSRIIRPGAASWSRSRSEWAFDDP